MSYSPNRRDWLLILPCISAIVVVVTVIIVVPVRGGSGGLNALLFALLNLLVPLGLIALILISSRFWPRGRLVVVITTVLVSAFMCAALISLLFDTSSTAGLLLVFLPIELGIVLLAFTGLTALVNWIRTRKAGQRLSA